MTSPADIVRGLINAADRHRRVANAAESARVKIRLGEKPVTSRGRLWFKPQEPTHHVTQFDEAETSAIYEALAKVRDENNAAADNLEQRVSVAEDR